MKNSNCSTNVPRSFINKANELVKNANYTTVVKTNNSAPALVFFVSNEFSLAASYTTESTYIIIDNKMYRLK